MKYPTALVGSVFDVISGATPSSGNPVFWDGDIPWVGPADLGKLNTRFISGGSRGITQEGYDSCGTAIVPAGTIILSSRAPIGHVAIAEQDLCFNQGCKGLVPRSAIHSRYGFWAITAIIPDLQAAGQGTTFLELGRSKLRAARIPFPNIPQQHLIADFLDEQTDRIDQLIVKKNRLTELLEEQTKQMVAEISSGSIMTNAAMRETGFDHIPNIPCHWSLLKAGYLFREVDERNHDDLPVLSVSIHSGITDKQLDAEERDRKVNLIEDRSTYKRVRPGYLVYNMMRAWQGGIGVSAVDGAVSPAYVVAKPTREIHTPYFQFILRTAPFVEQMRRGSKGITDFRLRLYWDQFRRITLPIPPIEEQRSIAGEAKHRLSHTDIVASKIQHSINLLQEYRASLITAAVTGQIDVTTWKGSRSAAAVSERLEELA